MLDSDKVDSAIADSRGLDIGTGEPLWSRRCVLRRVYSGSGDSAVSQVLAIEAQECYGKGTDSTHDKPSDTKTCRSRESFGWHVLQGLEHSAGCSRPHTRYHMPKK